MGQTLAHGRTLTGDEGGIRMRKTLILSTFLLLCAVWAGAQTSGSSSSSGSQTQPSTSSGSQTGSTSSQTGSQTGSMSGSENAQTVEGCLGGSAGNFTLTSSSGTTYQLAGDTSKLSNHVGEQVEITGSTSSASASSTSPSSSASSSTSPSASASGAAGGGQTLTVQKVRKIASSCSTGK